MRRDAGMAAENPVGNPIGSGNAVSAAPNPNAQFEAEALPHLNDLYRAAASILHNRAEAEDAVQEAYLQALKSFQRFTPGTNCRAWLFRILFHRLPTAIHRNPWRFRRRSQLTSRGLLRGCM